jgi:hypothetical protein
LKKQDALTIMGDQHNTSANFCQARSSRLSTRQGAADAG